MPKQTILGIDGKLYRNTASYATPTWSEIDNVADLGMPLTKGEANVTTREAAWELMKGSIKKASLTFKMISDPSDTDWTTLRDAWLNGTVIEFACVDGPIATVGTQGLRASFEVFTFTQTEDNEGVIMTDVELKPTRSDNAPAWMTVSS